MLENGGAIVHDELTCADRRRCLASEVIDREIRATVSCLSVKHGCPSLFGFSVPLAVAE